MSSEHAPDEFDGDGISFGNVEQTQPDQELRPDENKHYAVAPVFQPRSHDLPIYVDIDALLDMERHALTDTSVELGGVMLGGQYVDSDGNPFVVISDSLRAEHYESTKGSFKFTHQTWSEITRQREEFPDDLQMVGWYHTHPDWGVFLSGMDMFICRNFFNKLLDVALVIDPCRQDRGMFMWMDANAGRVRRTDGFYLIGSRFREQELLAVASQLESENPMVDPRFSGASNPQVIQVGGQNPPWMMTAVLGMLCMQMALLTLLAWKLLTPVDNAPADKQLEKLQDQVERIAQTQEDQIGAEAQLRVLDQVVSQFGAGGRPDPVSLLAKKDAELLKARQKMDVATAAGFMAVEKHEQEKLAAQKLRDTLTGLTEELKETEAERDQLKKFKNSIEKAKKDGEEGKGEQQVWLWGAVAAVGFFLAAALGARFVGQRDTPPPAEPSPRFDEPTDEGESS